jgi:hypothetical protein
VSLRKGGSERSEQAHLQSDSGERPRSLCLTGRPAIDQHCDFIDGTEPRSVGSVINEDDKKPSTRSRADTPAVESLGAHRGRHFSAVRRLLSWPVGCQPLESVVGPGMLHPVLQPRLKKTTCAIDVSPYIIRTCGRNSVVECQLPKLDVRSSNLLARS